MKKTTKHGRRTLGVRTREAQVSKRLSHLTKNDPGIASEKRVMAGDLADEIVSPPRLNFVETASQSNTNRGQIFTAINGIIRNNKATRGNPCVYTPILQARNALQRRQNSFSTITLFVTHIPTGGEHRRQEGYARASAVEPRRSRWWSATKACTKNGALNYTERKFPRTSRFQHACMRVLTSSRGQYAIASRTPVPIAANRNRPLKGCAHGDSSTSNGKQHECF